MIGPKTRNGWVEFKTDVYSGKPDLIGKESIKTIQEKLNGIREKKDHDFVHARRCINGNEKAHAIADLAKKFLVDLYNVKYNRQGMWKWHMSQKF